MMTEASTLSSHTAGVTKKNSKQMHPAGSLQEKIMITSLLFGILGLIGNGLLLWPLCCTIKWSRFTLYFQHMAAANVTLIFYNFVALTEFFIPLHKNIVISQIVDVLGLCGHDASFFVLTAAAAERCLTVYFPNWWQHHRPKHFTITVCVILWLLSGLMPLAGYFACFPRVRATNETEFVSCKNPAISQMIIVLLIFISILGFSASAIFMKMKINQAPPPARLDITILTTVLLFLIFNAPLRVLIIMTFWDPPTDKKLAGTVFLLFSSIYSSGISFACLFIGYLNRRDDLEPIAVFLERILKDERNMAETTEADQQQA